MISKSFLVIFSSEQIKHQDWRPLSGPQIRLTALCAVPSADVHLIKYQDFQRQKCRDANVKCTNVKFQMSNAQIRLTALRAVPLDVHLINYQDFQRQRCRLQTSNATSLKFWSRCISLCACSELDFKQRSTAASHFYRILFSDQFLRATWAFRRLQKPVSLMGG